MTDLHTHILPGVDDGAKSPEESLTLLKMERQQGVDTVVLTPHFYRERETVSEFLHRRGEAMDKLRAVLPESSPKLILGAEVAWYSSLGEEPELEKLCLGSSKHILLELPYAAWSKYLVEQIYQFASNSGLIPIIAHVERYLPLQKPGQVTELFRLGLPMQMSADALTQPLKRRKMLELLKQGEWYIGTDCHNTEKRKPDMAKAVQYLHKQLPEHRVREMLSWQDL